MYKFTTEPLESMEKGTWIGIMSTLAGTYHFKHEPHVQKFGTAACERDVSIKIPTDFLFIDTFSGM